MFLLDTNVISELRRPRPHGGLLAWVALTDPNLLRLPAVAFGELQIGVEKIRTRDPAKAEKLESWINELAKTYVVVSMDGAAFRHRGRLIHRRKQRVYEDAMIAATAIVHGLTVVTRNIRDFEPFGVPLLDPFTPPP